ncbi:MAG: SGNH/GDSL hydrolase family protein [Microgenomates group bacterium]
MDKIKKALTESGKYWIAFVGDSITSTEWVHPNWREMVEYVLKEEMNDEFPNFRTPNWGIRCFNFGYDGSTSRDIVNKLDDISGAKPNLMILMIGANDPTQGVSQDEYKNNLENILERMKKDNIEIWLSTCNKAWNDRSNELCLPYVEIQRNLGLNNFIDLDKESDNFPKEKIYTFVSECDIVEENIKKGDLDFWHPNQLGNAYIAKVILKKIWNIDFDPEKYIETTNKGYKYPEYQ